jgi:hypothetical protein
VTQRPVEAKSLLFAGAVMVEDPGDRRPTDDIARIYLGIVAAAEGHRPEAVAAALAMSVVLLGEQRGLKGADLLEWIDTIAATARLAAQVSPADRMQPN